MPPKPSADTLRDARHTTAAKYRCPLLTGTGHPLAKDARA